MDEWISKKELLSETGISYGQLYRWKREGLIPDSWFVKRSAFTGQETYLPRAQALDRIRFILEHKDAYTLSQLQELLQPGAESRVYTADMLMECPDAFRPLMMMMEITGADALNHGQAMCVLIAARAVKAAGEMDDGQLRGLLEALRGWQDAFDLAKDTDGRLIVLRAGGSFVPLYLHPESRVEVGADAAIVYEMPLSDIPASINKQLNAIMEEK